MKRVVELNKDQLHPSSRLGSMRDHIVLCKAEIHKASEDLEKVIAEQQRIEQRLTTVVRARYKQAESFMQSEFLEVSAELEQLQPSLTRAKQIRAAWVEGLRGAEDRYSHLLQHYGQMVSEYNEKAWSLSEVRREQMVTEISHLISPAAVEFE